MYSRVMNLFNGIDSRYPTAEEEQQALAYAASVPRRLQAANHVQQAEAGLVQAAVDEMRRRYPRFHGLHDRAWEKTTRDMGLCLRYAVQAMVAEDADMANRKLFVWLGTIVRSMGMTPQMMRDAYDCLHQQARKKLPAETFALMDPYLRRLTADMSNFAEPLRPAVG